MLSTKEIISLRTILPGGEKLSLGVVYKVFTKLLPAPLIQLLSLRRQRYGFCLNSVEYLDIILDNFHHNRMDLKHQIETTSLSISLFISQSPAPENLHEDEENNFGLFNGHK